MCGIAGFNWEDRELVGRMADAGHAGSLLLGGDTARRSNLRVHGGGPGMAHLFAVLVPRLRKAFGSDLVDRLVVANPARAFAFEPEPPAERTGG